MCPDPGSIEKGAPCRRRDRVGGFTLIEMMIVVAVIAILTAVVLPSYQGSIRKARRTDARGALSMAAQCMERWNTQQNTYVGATFTTATIAGTLPCRSTSENGYYGLVASNLTATTFTVTATPVGDQAVDSCGTYTLDQAGTRGSAGPVTQCW